jgi:hypothetical protein
MSIGQRANASHECLQNPRRQRRVDLALGTSEQNSLTTKWASALIFKF